MATGGAVGGVGETGDEVGVLGVDDGAALGMAVPLEDEFTGGGNVLMGVEDEPWEL